MPPVTVQQACQIAFAHQQAGRLAEAEALYLKILEVSPRNLEVLHLFGVIAYQTGRSELAAKLIGEAVRLDPNNPTTLTNLGEVFRTAGRLAEAIDAHHRALRLKPDYPQVHDNLGKVFMNQGKLAEAIAAHSRALQLSPHNADACNNLGAAFAASGRFDEAIAAYRRAIQLRPDSPEAHNNLGNTLLDLDRFEEAIAEYRLALQHQPDRPEALTNLGAALMHRGQTDEAIALHRRALQLKPNLADACNNLANALKDQGRLSEAIGAYRGALLIDPKDSRAHNNLIFALSFQPGESEAAISAEKQRWNQQISEPLRRSISAFPIKPHSNGRLRIGYVSPDFRDHVVGRQLMPLIRNHNSADFEILCYAGVVRGDALTNEYQRHIPLWRNTVGVSDDHLAQTIRRDEIDILVDLTQHLAGNRLAVFARNSAPVQVSFAGYPEGTGLEAIGYRISDRWLESETGGEDAIGVEGTGRAGKIENAESAAGVAGEDGVEVARVDRKHERIYLIDSFWCYDPCAMEVVVNELPAAKDGQIAFGSLNNFCKVNDLVLMLWARVLARVKGSRLILLSGLGSHRQRTVDFLAKHGVQPGQVEFVAPCPRKDYLELYHGVDIVLDPFPYGGHTTSLDALWMGVPVVSLAGDRAVSRAGVSILNNLGLPELVTFSEDDYVKTAVKLAKDLPRLAELRRTLRSRMANSVLMDAPHFARQIEAAYRAMWRDWCTKQRGPA
jgi:predicted O-linked N-acetylglucosamine transferase (SPINDLY family)